MADKPLDLDSHRGMMKILSGKCDSVKSTLFSGR
jgi:hypothetical protein